jgi:hypothetical protein
MPGVPSAAKEPDAPPYNGSGVSFAPDAVSVTFWVLVPLTVTDWFTDTVNPGAFASSL